MNETTALARQDDTTMQMVPVSNDQYGHIEAAQRSAIQARTAVALARPRDLLEVRAKLLAAAQRPGFAEQAEYALPRGGKSVTGPTVRMAEECKRAMGNMVTGLDVIHEDAVSRIVRVSVADMEANTYDYQDVTVKKTMERKTPKDSDTILGKRTASEGHTVYTVVCPEGELAVIQAAQVAKVKRNLILQATPGDLIEEAMAEARHTRTHRDAVDPAGATKRIADAFMDDLRIPPAALAQYLGHPLAQCNPIEMDDLRGIYAAIRDGHTTWVDVTGTREQTRNVTDSAAGKVAAALATSHKKKAPTAPTTMADVQKAADDANARKAAGLTNDYGLPVATHQQGPRPTVQLKPDETPYEAVDAEVVA